MAKTILDGIRVLDIANENGVYCTKLLAQMGAEVIKVEPPRGDSTRFIGPFVGNEEDVEKSLFHLSNNAGKKSITLDITQSPGKEVFLKLVEEADVLVETSKPGTMKDLGLDYESLKKVNPQLIMCSMTPFGQTGPYAKWNVSSDIVPFAMSGPMHEYGDPDREPLHVAFNFLANGAGVYAVTGILALIYAKELKGTGEYMDISLFDVAGTWRDMAIGKAQVPPYEIQKRIGSQGRFIPFNYYKCKDGYVALSGIVQWEQCIQWLKDEGIDVGDFEDPKYLPDNGYNKLRFEHVDEFNVMVSELASRYTALEMMKVGQSKGVPVGKSETAESILDNPQYKERGVFTEVNHPMFGKYLTSKAVANYSEAGLISNVRAPYLGEHNNEIFAGLGLSATEISQLGQQPAM